MIVVSAMEVMRILTVQRIVLENLVREPGSMQIQEPQLQQYPDLVTIGL